MTLTQNVVRRPVLTIIVFGLIAMLAVFLAGKLAVEMLPNMEMPMLVVATTYPGADPETVEKTVTKPLESSLVNISGLKAIESSSREHTSVIVLEFDYGADLDMQANKVRENIDRARGSLPDNAAAPLVATFDPNSDPILRIALSSPSRDQNELRALAKDVLKSRLEQIDGVAEANVEGGTDRIVRVEISQNRLDAYKVTITEIAGALSVQNMELGAGYIKDGNSGSAVNYAIRTSGEFASIADVANTVVAQINGADIRLQDIGEVSFGYQDASSEVYVNGQKGVFVAVMKQSGKNSVAIADEVYARMDKLKAVLPADVSLDVTMDDTTQTRAMINELIQSAIFGIALAMLVLLVFLRNVNGTIIVGLSIPLSVLMTMLVMSLVGINLNMMTLAGLILGLGMVVDSSIVVLENIFQFREKGEKPTIAAVLGTDEVLSSIIASTLTTICVFLPMFIFKNDLEIVGIMVQDLIFTIVISLVSSLVVAMFLVPVLASKYLPLHTKAEKPLKNRALIAIDKAIGGALDGIARAYRKALQAALRHRAVTIILVIAAFAGSAIALTKLNVVLVPSMDPDIVTMSVEMPLGTPYEDTLALVLEMEEYAEREIKGMKSIVATAGDTGNISFDAQGSYKGELVIRLDLDDKNADSGDAVMQKLRSHWADFPNAVFAFSNQFDDMLGGSDIDVVLHIEDVHQGYADANNIVKLIGDNISSVTDLAIDMNAGLPEVSVHIDRARAYNFGLNVAGIASEIAASMNGTTATSLRYDGEQYDVVLMLREEDRKKIPDLDQIFVRANSGLLLPVSNFAETGIGTGPVEISREDQDRVIHITGNVVAGHNLADAEKEVKALLADTDYEVTYAGESAETQNMVNAFIMVIIMALLLVFGVMAGQYESFKDPIINFCTIPLILIGVVAIHIITGFAVSAFTMMGFVMLAGIVVNNGIILVDYTNLLVRRDNRPVMDACLEAGETRLRPVLMTALTTILGVVPMAFFPGASATMTQPIGLAIIGGLTSATFITLFFIPVMYSIVNGKKQTKGVVA
ncbi:multidrug ABC transporter [Spirochaetia bacterium]|nr:multidrug ABC transporter [Spirochaetia bacterium]